MSKSYNNALFLTDAPEEIDGKIRVMMTDPARKRRNDPGNPDVCPVFDFSGSTVPRRPSHWSIVSFGPLASAASIARR